MFSTVLYLEGLCGHKCLNSPGASKSFMTVVLWSKAPRPTRIRFCDCWLFTNSSRSNRADDWRSQSRVEKREADCFLATSLHLIFNNLSTADCMIRSRHKPIAQTTSFRQGSGLTPLPMVSPGRLDRIMSLYSLGSPVTC